MKLPFGPKAKQRKQELEKARKLLARMDAARRDDLQTQLQHATDAAENATRHAMFQTTTVWQLHLLVDQLRTENVRLSHEAERPTGDGILTLNRDEALLTHRILDGYIEGIDEDDALYNDRARIKFLTDRLHGALE